MWPTQTLAVPRGSHCPGQALLTRGGALHAGNSMFKCFQVPVCGWAASLGGETWWLILVWANQPPGEKNVEQQMGRAKRQDGLFPPTQNLAEQKTHGNLARLPVSWGQTQIPSRRARGLGARHTTLGLALCPPRPFLSQEQVRDPRTPGQLICIRSALLPGRRRVPGPLSAYVRVFLLANSRTLVYGA